MYEVQRNSMFLLFTLLKGAISFRAYSCNTFPESWRIFRQRVLKSYDYSRAEFSSIILLIFGCSIQTPMKKNQIIKNSPM